MLMAVLGVAAVMRCPVVVDARTEMMKTLVTA
jgi:hypothetical protein